MSAIPRPARSARLLTQSAKDRGGSQGGSTRRLPPPPLPAERPPKGNTRRLPPPPLPHRQRREEDSDVALLDCAPGTKLQELARFTPPDPLPTTPPETPPPSAEVRTNTGRVRKHDSAWREALAASGIACRVCGSSLDASGSSSCRRCGESAPRPGDTPSSSIGLPLPPAPPARRLVLLGALSCAAVGLPVTLFLDGEARQVALAFDLLVGALAGPWARKGAGLSAFTLAGATASGAKVAIGTLLGSAALSWDALQTDPLLLGLLGATLFATVVLGGLLGLTATPVEGELALER